MVNFYYHDLKNEVQILKKKHEFEQTWNWLKFDTGLICIWVGPNEKCVKSWKTLKSQSFIVVPFTPKINSYWLHIYIYIYTLPVTFEIMEQSIKWARTRNYS